jgi:hypothetical protein
VTNNPQPDPELVNLAAKLTNSAPDQIMAAAWRDDALVVVIQPGPKYIFTAQQIADAVPGTLLRAPLAPMPPEPAPEHEAPPKKHKAR